MSRTKNSPELWEQAVAHLRAIAGVESAAYAGFALLTYERQTGPVAAPGLAPSGKRAYFLDTSPNWLSTMNVKLLDGLDFRPGDVNPGMAIVNETFVREFLGGDHPVGKWFERADGDGSRIRFQVIGLAADARYHELRGPVLPVAYVPFAKSRVHAVLLVKTTGANPRSMSSLLRQEVTRGRPELRVANVITQQELNDAQSIRERLLALLAAFFGGVALLLAAVGLYGVLDYSVLQRRKEIGIRMALGARAAHIARSLTSRAFSMVFAGSLAGFVLAMAGARFIESLLFQVGSKDAAMITAPSLTILAAAALAALPAIARALHIDPVEMLRSE